MQIMNVKVCKLWQFWQIPIRKQDRKYTAFLYKNKSYQNRVVPFRLSTSLAAIVKCLENALGQEVKPYTMILSLIHI